MGLLVSLVEASFLLLTEFPARTGPSLRPVNVRHGKAISAHKVRVLKKVPIGVVFFGQANIEGSKQPTYKASGAGQ